MERAAAGAAGAGGGSLRSLPAPQLPSTPRRCPAEQPLKPSQPPRSQRRGRGSGPGQWPRRSGRPGAAWVRALRAAPPGAPEPPRRALRAPPAEPGLSRRRCASRRARSESRPSPARPAPSLARRAPAHVGPAPACARTRARAPPARALAALQPPLRPPRRFPARRIPGNCARPRPALPLGFLGLVVRAASSLRLDPRARGALRVSSRAHRVPAGLQPRANSPCEPGAALCSLGPPGDTELSRATLEPPPGRQRGSPPALLFVSKRPA